MAGLIACLLLVLCLVIPSARLFGQSAESVHRFPVWHPSLSSQDVVVPGSAPLSMATIRALADSNSTGGSHWREGAVIGGVAFGVLGALFGHGLCESNAESRNSQCLGAAVGSAVVVGAVGAVIGGLVGAQFSK